LHRQPRLRRSLSGSPVVAFTWWRETSGSDVAAVGYEQALRARNGVLGLAHLRQLAFQPFKDRHRNRGPSSPTKYADSASARSSRSIVTTSLILISYPWSMSFLHSPRRFSALFQRPQLHTAGAFLCAAPGAAVSGSSDSVRARFSFQRSSFRLRPETAASMTR
jgi:hypothetical protein